jgi:hypothetical protein
MSGPACRRHDRHLIVASAAQLTPEVCARLRDALEAHPGETHTQVLLYTGETTRLVCLRDHPVTPSPCLDAAIAAAFEVAR